MKKLLSFATFSALLAISACSHHHKGEHKSCCDKKDKVSCDKGDCKNEAKKACCSDDHCKKKS